jgi:hypothetical protein
VISDWVSAGKFISLVATVTVIAGLYRLTHDMYDRKNAFLTAVVFSLIPEVLLLACFNNFIKIMEFESGNKVVAVYCSVTQYHKMTPHS